MVQLKSEVLQGMLTRATALLPFCPHTLPLNRKGAGDSGIPSVGAEVQLLHSLPNPIHWGYPPILIGSNYQVLIIVYMHDIISPLKQPYNPHFREVNIEALSRWSMPWVREPLPSVIYRMAQPAISTSPIACYEIAP